MIPLTDGQSELAARYIPLARSIARRRLLGCLGSEFSRRPEWREWYDELTSEAYIALCTAVRDFREPSTIRLSTFIRHRVEDVATVVLGRLRRRAERCLGRRRRAKLPFVPHRESIDTDDILRQLPSRSAEALRLTAIEGISQRRAAVIMGCSQSEVSRQARLARKLLSPIEIP